MKDALGYYKILEINTPQDMAELKNKYHSLAKMWHPDSNQDPSAMEHFQKLSTAYDILKDDEKRLEYDLLSEIYTEQNFPDINNLNIIKDQNQTESPLVRVVVLQKVIGKILSYTNHTDKLVCTYSQAKQEVLRYSLINWFCGWWHLKAFISNIKAIIHNISNIGSNKTDNLILLIHNAIAYKKAQKKSQSIISATQALQYCTPSQSILVKQFIASENPKKMPKNVCWHTGILKIYQLIIPLVLILLISYPYIQKKSLWKYMQKNNEITFFQKVKLNNGKEIMDDVVVSKIFSIPVNLNDNSKLYHLKEETNIMYGPSERFDVISKGKANQTVRLTGLTADKKWYRIMIDSGEMGFVSKQFLQFGVGTPPPYGSKIVSQN